MLEWWPTGSIDATVFFLDDHIKHHIVPVRDVKYVLSQLLSDPLNAPLLQRARIHAAHTTQPSEVNEVR